MIAFLTQLDVLGGNGINLVDAIEDVFSAAKERHLIVDFAVKPRPFWV